jgi:hypothetical protein
LRFEKILVTKNAYESDDKYDLIQAVIDFVNHIRSQGIEPDQVNVDAVNSYFVDYYSTEFCNGAFSQFIHNSGATDFILDCVAEGLQKMSASKNLEFFLKCRQLVTDLSESELSEFQASEYFGENETRDKIDVYKWEFFDIKKVECIEDIHHEWLKSNDSVVALTSEEFTAEMNKIKSDQ